MHFQRRADDDLGQRIEFFMHAPDACKTRSERDANKFESSL